MDKQAVSEMERRNNRTGRERGFTLLQLLITLAIAGIVSTFALVAINRSRDYIRLQNSVRQLAGYIEKARLDAIRRHATSSVTFTNSSTYSVSMDFDGTGTVGTRSFSFDTGVTVISTPFPSVSFNWRGRTSACTITFAMQNTEGEQSWVDVSDAGDVTVNSDVDVLPTVSYASVNTTSDVATGTVASGAGLHSNTVDCGDTSGSSTTSPPVTGTGTACSMTASVSSLTIHKNGGSTGSVTLSTTGTGTFTITPSGTSNLTISPTYKTVAGGSPAAFLITSNNKTRGTFAVNFSSSCTTVTVTVKVTN
jgi:prepilin-type N-terminal cleavage/methylation domain-containing protein